MVFRAARAFSVCLRLRRYESSSGASTPAWSTGSFCLSCSVPLLLLLLESELAEALLEEDEPVLSEGSGCDRCARPKREFSITSDLERDFHPSGTGRHLAQLLLLKVD